MPPVVIDGEVVGRIDAEAVPLTAQEKVSAANEEITDFFECTLKPLMNGETEKMFLESQWKDAYDACMILFQMWNETSPDRMDALDMENSILTNTLQIVRGKKRWARFDRAVLMSYIAKHMEPEKAADAITLMHQARRAKKRRMLSEVHQAARQRAEAQIEEEQALSEPSDDETDRYISQAEAQMGDMPSDVHRRELEAKLAGILREVSDASPTSPFAGAPSRSMETVAKMLIESFSSPRGPRQRPADSARVAVTAATAAVAAAASLEPGDSES